jgi:hypothetical protein
MQVFNIRIPHKLQVIVGDEAVSERRAMTCKSNADQHRDATR